MRQMKNSGIDWIGEIPEAWGIVLLSSIFHQHKEKNSRLQETNLLSLSYGRIIQKDINTSEGLLPASFDTYNIIDDGDIVFRLTDLQNDQRSLRTGLCTQKGIITSAYITLRKNVDLDNRYMHYLFHSYDICKVFYGMGDGVRQGMSFEDLKRLLVLFPNIKVQQIIADFLDKKCADIDSLIAHEAAAIEELKAYKQSVITVAVTQGLDKSVPMRDSGIEWIGQIAENHEVIRLKFLLTSQPQYGANESGERISENSVRYIRITDITSENKLNDDENNLYLPKDKAQGYILRDKDILLARSGATVGKSFIYYSFYGESAFAGYLIKIECNSTKLLPEYFFYFTQSSLYESWKNMIFIQATIQNIGAGKYANLEMIITDIEAQKSIIEYLNNKCADIDGLISIKQQKIEELKEYKKSLIYEYVTGKKEVA